MGWREKIADWISGGELSRLRGVVCEEADRSRRLTHRAKVILHENGAMASALKEIAAQETPGANATVKRMARIAREAMTWE